MGLVQFFGGNFFTEMTAIGSGVVGQVGWTPVPHLYPQPHIIEVDRVEPGSHGAAKARWTTLTDKHFTSHPDKKYPILNAHLGETEELLAFKAKRRPAVVVGTAARIYSDVKASDHHQEIRLVMAPIYGVRTEDDPKGFDGVLVTRVRHLMYRQFFPFAEWKEKRVGKVQGAQSFEAGLIRFDRLQFVRPSPPGLRLAPVRLSDDVIAVMHAMLWSYLHAPVSPSLAEMQDLLLSCLPSEAQPKS